ncbi:MAG: Hsp20/alpha crystallin family protein [Casimicrobiaceae bacterium]
MTRLVQYYSPLDHVLDRAFGSMFAPSNGDASATPGGFVLDVIETPDSFIVKADVPGIAKDLINVKVEDRDVTISYETTEAAAPEGKALWRERRYGKVSRSIRLPAAVDANAAQAKHVDGVLELTLPKFVKANARQITIQ